MYYLFEAFLDNLVEEPFSIYGGESITIYTQDELIGDGDFITNSCNSDFGCEYQPARSLTKWIYEDSSNPVMTLSINPPEGTVIRINQVKLLPESFPTSSSSFLPEAYIQYVSLQTKSQIGGLIMIIFGFLMVDILPASIFYSFQKSGKEE